MNTEQTAEVASKPSKPYGTVETGPFTSVETERRNSLA